ncbi:hypothetical protein D3C71_1225440 [compost metagenome]
MFLGQHARLVVQFQGAGTEVITEAVTQLVVVRTFGPVQRPHVTAPGFDADDVMLFTIGLAVNFQTGEVTHFREQGAAAAVGESRFAQAVAGAVVAVAFVVVGLGFAVDQRHAAQLIAAVPEHGLPALQFLLIATGIETRGDIGLARQ